jgi:hypothetical protein
MYRTFIYNHVYNPIASIFSIEHFDSGPDGWKHAAHKIKIDGLAQPLFTQ